MINIAVYGSLKKGRYNHGILEGAELLGKSTVKGQLYSMGAYPALVRQGENKYEVELYSVSEEVFNPIDRMELGAGYVGEKRTYATASGEVEATTYFAGIELKEYCEEKKEKINSY